MIKKYGVRLSLILWSILILGATASFADTIKLKSGEVINGKIVERTNDYIKVDRGIGINLTYYIADIASEGESLEDAPKIANPDVKNFERERLSFDDFVKLRELFENRKFEELEQEFSSYQRDFESNHLKEDKIYDALDVFLIDDDNYGSLADEWVQRMPDSFVSHLVRAKVYYNLGWKARGGNWATETTDMQMNMMHTDFQIAFDECDKTLKINPKVLPAYGLTFLMYAEESNKDAGEVINDVFEFVPESYRFRIQVMHRMTPRWGGSYEVMEAFAKDADRFLDKNPSLRLLRALIYIDQASMLGLESSTEGDMMATSLKNAMPMLTSVISTAQMAVKSPQNNDEEREKELARKKLALYEQAMSFGENTIVYYERAISEMQLGDDDSAISDLKKAIKLCPTYDDAYRGLSAAYSRKKDSDESWKYLKMADKLGGNSQKATITLMLADAAAKLKTENYPGVIEVTNKIIAIDSKNSRAYFQRGFAWISLDQYDKAIPDFNRCIELEHENLSAYENLSYIYQKRGDLKKSLDYITEGLKYHPEDGEAHYKRGFIIFLMGDKKKADEEGKIACDLGYKKGCD